MRVAVFFQELHHYHVVVQRVSCGYDLEEIGGMLLHPGKSFFQFFCAAKIMVREDQVGGAPQTVEIRLLELRGGLQLNIHQVAAQVGGFGQHVDFRGD